MARRRRQLTVLQDHYAACPAALPDSQPSGATADALQAICDLDLADRMSSIRREASAGTDLHQPAPADLEDQKPPTRCAPSKAKSATLEGVILGREKGGHDWKQIDSLGKW